jgi:tetratricopeptide (TPR) repeat protein
MLGAPGLAIGALAAQTKKPAKDAKEAAAPKRDVAAIQRMYAAGLRAFEAGDMAGAEQQLSSALAGGGLPNAQMAKALYYRGSAYRQLGRPAQAISDLTTAVWLKGGLSEDDKKKAMDARQAAYREAGLGDSAPPIGGAPLDQAKDTASAAPAAPAAKPGTLVASAPQSSSFWSFLPTMPTMPSLPSLSFGGSQPAAEPVAAGITTTPPVAPASGYAPAPEAASSWETQTATVEAVPSGDAYSPAASPTAAAWTPPAEGASAPAAAEAPGSSVGTSVGSFFSNMFGGGSASSAPQATSLPSSTMTTGSTHESAAAWGSETTVNAQTSSMVQRGPDSPPAALPWQSETVSQAAPAPARTAAVGGGGRYKLQVAAVRSREEAEKLAETLRGYQAVQNGVVTPEIDEAVIGSMGTFYRVRLGPYADATEPGQLCKTLKPQGFDCLVVTQ